MNNDRSPQRRRERGGYAVAHFSALTPRSLRLCVEVLLVCCVLITCASARQRVIDLASFDRDRILNAANQYLKEKPTTITASSSPRSTGGPHDYFSESDYWWPDP